MYVGGNPVKRDLVVKGPFQPYKSVWKLKMKSLCKKIVPDQNAALGAVWYADEPDF